MRYIGLDLGDRRTGLAAGDSVTNLAAPLEVIEVSVLQRDGKDLLDAVARVIEAQLGPAPVEGGAGAPGELVVGLPLNMDGTEGPRAKLVRAFAARIAGRTGRAVHFQDERLTTAAADWSMARTGMTRQQKKDRRDAIAAATMLQDFLNARGGQPPAPSDFGG